MHGMDWDDLRYFTAAAEAGSLSAAAKRLDCNQPTVGRRIDALEKALGVRLFHRHAKGLTLTREGALVFEHALAMDASVATLHRRMKGRAEGDRGVVNLALPEGLCMEAIVPALPGFHAAHSDIRLELNVSADSADLTRGESDVAIRLFRPEAGELVARRLGELRLGLYASPAYLEREGMPTTPEALRRHRVITYGERLAGLAENRWLLERTDASLRVLSSDSTGARLDATAAGLGISIQPRLFSITRPQLHPLLAEAPLPHHELWLVYHEGLRDLGRVRAVVDFVASTLEGLLARLDEADEATAPQR